MSKVTLTDLSSLANQTAAMTTINNNSALIETAFDNTLSRDGTSPNAMLADLDMNSNDILNLPAPSAPTNPIRLQEYNELLGEFALVEERMDNVETHFAELQVDFDEHVNEVQQLIESVDIDAALAAVVAAQAAQVAAELAESHAETAEINAEAAQTAAEAAETAASGYASTASSAASTATTQAGNASTSAGTASTAASTATTQAGIATTQAGLASTSASNALASENNAASLYDQFDDRYLGSKASDPTLDNDGNALLTGALYWNSSAGNLRVYNGATWSVYSASAGIANVVDDTSPQLGGTLDPNGFAITGYSTTSQIAAAYQPLDSDLTSWAGVTRAAGIDTFIATPSSANLKAAITDETGSGALVFATSPALVTPTGIVKGDVGLGNVDNTSDATKNAASVTLTNKAISGSANTLTNIPISALDTDIPVAGINFVIDGSGTTITTGSKGHILIPFSCTINGVFVFGNQTGSVVVDIKKSDYSGFPTTTSICASAKPTLTTVQKGVDSTLTGWTTTIAANDILEFNIDSVTSFQRLTIILKVTKT